MRWLIDGYNVMHAAGLLGPKLSREGFRRARRRFLDGLADSLPVEREGDVTVVFDASVPPGDFPLSSTYRGIRVVFALGDEDADSRIEYMLGHDSNPKTLTVVSSDNRIRQAASRRRARPLTADAFWDLKDEMSAVPTARTDRPPDIERNATPGAKETEFWLQAFREVENVPGIHDVVSPNAALLTDAEIAEIHRLIDREG
jgi:predicted RNA-binding protein with PIN domain